MAAASSNSSSGSRVLVTNRKARRDFLVLKDIECGIALCGTEVKSVRAAKASLNGIDPIDVRRSYRYEQGFTYELNLRGIGDTAREAFLQGERGGEAPSA